jgi:GntR family transcriptional regulator
MLRRVHGVGSFVTERPVRHRLTTLNLDLSNSLRDAGEAVVHDLLGIAAEEQTGVPGGTFPDLPGPVARLRIRRRVGERPWSQTLAWLPASLLYPDPSLTPEASLADVLLERHGLRVAAAARSLTAEPADEIDAEHLDVAAGAPLLVLRGGNADQHGRRIGQVTERIRGDRVELALG